MKKALYKGAYRVASALSDLTGGASPAVKWKVTLGVALLSVSAGTLTGCKPDTTCYDPVPPETTCYDPATPVEDPGAGTGQGEEPDVMCYAPALPPDEGEGE